MLGVTENQSKAKVKEIKGNLTTPYTQQKYVIQAMPFCLCFSKDDIIQQL